MKKIALLLTWSMFLALGLHEVWARQDNIPAPVSFCGSGEQVWVEAGSTCHADPADRVAPPVTRKPPVPSTTDITEYYDLMVLHGTNYNKSFRMEYGACLRGPLQFFDTDGKVLFELEKDIEFPSGCGTGVAHLRN